MRRILALLLLLIPALPVNAEEPKTPGKIYNISRVGTGDGQVIYEIEFPSNPIEVDIQIATRLATAMAKSMNSEPTGKVQVVDGTAATKKLFIVGFRNRGDAFPQFLDIDKLSYFSPKTTGGAELFLFTCDKRADWKATDDHRREVAELLEQLYRCGASSKLKFRQPKQGSQYLSYES